MSIINLNKDFENKSLVYCNLNNKNIIKCVCLTELSKFYDVNYDEKFGYFTCNRIKIIIIYDIYKNIIYEPIQNYLFKNLIKIGNILENLEEKNIYFFKTFLGAYMLYNKLNDIKYIMSYNGIFI